MPLGFNTLFGMIRTQVNKHNHLRLINHQTQLVKNLK
jgi:hypothetical protein